MSKLRILFNSNSAWSRSGYGQQTQELLPRIKNEGYSIAASNFYGQAGGKFAIDGIMQYPVIKHTYGSDAMVMHGRDFKADVVIGLQDIWTLHPQDLQQITRWIPWLPIDHDPIPAHVVDKLQYAYKIIAMSRFGQQQLQQKGYHATYIPHSVDTKIFTPMNKFQRKKDTNLPPDSFVIGMVAANKDNPSRKSFQEALDAYKVFLESHPNALLYLHTDPDMPGGFPIKQYIKFLGLPDDKVLFPDPYEMEFNIGKSHMNLIYNTFDVLLAPSQSEGFCLPLIEAQACGVPVITTDFTAMPEMIIPKKTGELVAVGSKWFSQQGSYFGRPDTNSIIEALNTIYTADRVQMGKDAREHAVTHYDTTTVFDTYWKPFLEKIENRVYGIDKQ